MTPRWAGGFLRWLHACGFQPRWRSLSSVQGSRSRRRPRSPATTAVTSFDGTKIVALFFPAAGLPAGRRRRPSSSARAGRRARHRPEQRHRRPVRRDRRRPAARGRLQRPHLGPARLRRVRRHRRGRPPDVEGRDVQALIDYVAAPARGAARRAPATRASAWSARPTAAASSSSPRRSTRASTRSCRTSPGTRCVTSLYKDDTRQGRLVRRLLYSASAQAPRAPASTRTSRAPTRAGTPTGRAQRRGPRLVRVARPRRRSSSSITVPTLLIQGTVDTLFTLDEAITNYADPAHANGVPAKMLWFCGGHGACLTEPGDAGRDRARHARLARPLPEGRQVGRHRRRASSGSTRTAVALRRRRLPARRGRAARRRRQRARCRWSTAAARARRSPPSARARSRARRRRVAATRATNAVNVRDRRRLPAPLVVGAPQLTLTYTGTAADADARVFAPDRRRRPRQACWATRSRRSR